MDDQEPVDLAYCFAAPTSGICNDLAPIMLHHGLTSSKDRWKPLMQTLADKTRRKVYALDARNHGESGRSDFFSFNILAKDLDHFMKKENVEKAIHIGHSMGGMLAMTMALTLPERVKSIVVEDASPRELRPELCYVLSEMAKEQIRCLQKMPSTELEANVHQQLRECVYRTVPMIPDEDRDVLQNTEFPLRKTDKGYEPLTNLEVIAKTMQNFHNIRRNHSGVFDGSALFIYGQKSNMQVDEDKDLILQFFPKAQFYCAENAGHEVYGQCPNEYLEEVLKFLDD